MAGQSREFQEKQRTRGGHDSITFVNPYTGRTEHTRTEEEKTTYLRNQELAQYKKQREAKLGEWDENSGKFYDLMREGFRQRTQAASSAALTGGMHGLEQAAARSGTSFSGIQQAAQANLQGQIGAQRLQAESSYDQRLNEVRSQARDEFLSGQFSFFDSLQKMSHQVDLEKEFATFQADLADQYSSGWGDFFNVVGSVVGMAAGGGFGAVGGAVASAFGGGGGGQGFVGESGPRQYPYP